MNESDDEILIANILRDLNIPQDEINLGNQVHIPVFDQILKMPTLGFLRLALDAAVVAGSMGDWENSFLISERLIKEGDSEPRTKLWHIRTIVEREHFSEALALTTSTQWPPGLKIHADFLTATCYYRLNMKSYAEKFYTAVKNSDPQYPGLADFNLE